MSVNPTQPSGANGAEDRRSNAYPSPIGDSGPDALDVLSRFVAAIEHTPLVAIQSFSRDGVVHLWNSSSNHRNP